LLQPETDELYKKQLNNMAVQTCDQAITFRNFDYSRALEIVQDEEYLDDVEFDEIRVSRKQGEVFQAIDNFKEKVDNNFDIVWEDSDILGEFDEHHREKRQYATERDNMQLQRDFAEIMLLAIQFYEDFSQILLLVIQHYQGLPGIATTVLATAAMLIVANPAPSLTPSRSPQPGSLGGGGLPSANPGNILELVPDGLVPVATFPPFLPVDRVIPAVAVIFREQPGTVAGTDLTNKRSSGYSPQPTLLDRFLKNVRCLGPRLTAKFGKKPAPVVDYGYGKATYFVF
jgi:hypothetical protein